MNQGLEECKANIPCGHSNLTYPRTEKLVNAKGTQSEPLEGKSRGRRQTKVDPVLYPYRIKDCRWMDNLAPHGGVAPITVTIYPMGGG